MVGILIPPRRASLAPRGKHSDSPEVDILLPLRRALFTVKINIARRVSATRDRHKLSCVGFDSNILCTGAYLLLQQTFWRKLKREVFSRYNTSMSEGIGSKKGGFKVPREIVIGGFANVKRISLGGENPIALQTMWKESIAALDTQKFTSILERIASVEALGCDIIRFAVPDMQSAASLCQIAQCTHIPLVADIHFDYRLALECLKGDVAAIRINPGNIGSTEHTKALVELCREKGRAMRIGVNSGSLPQDLAQKAHSGEIPRSKALVEAALREAAVFDEMGFSNYAVSMKASSVRETVEANEAFARLSDTPLHVGVTEAGPLICGIVKSTLAFSQLLGEGIGSTIRVSLSSSMENEVIAGKEILRECGLRKGGVTLVSCPRCGRLGFDVHSFVERWQNRLLSLDKDITVAVMGCAVNGPGEGRWADLGITGGGGKCVIFKKGKIVRTVDEENADKVFAEELESL